MRRSPSDILNMVHRHQVYRNDSTWETVVKITGEEIQPSTGINCSLIETAAVEKERKISVGVDLGRLFR